MQPLSLLLVIIAIESSCQLAIGALMWSAADCSTGITQSFTSSTSGGSFEANGCTYAAYVGVIATSGSTASPTTIAIIGGSVASSTSNGISLEAPSYATAMASKPLSITVQ
eukprot:PhF_6_TR39201/c0_g1_i1/m.58574